MKPLPKVVGVLAMLAAVFGAANAAVIPDTSCVITAETACDAMPLLKLLPPVVGTWIAAIGAIVATLSHSLTGTGGKK